MIRRSFLAPTSGNSGFGVPWGIFLSETDLFGAIPRGPLRLYRKAVAHWLPPLSDKLIDPVLRAALIEEFRPEVEKLGILIGRDLSHWNE